MFTKSFRGWQLTSSTPNSSLRMSLKRIAHGFLPTGKQRSQKSRREALIFWSGEERTMNPSPTFWEKRNFTVDHLQSIEECSSPALRLRRLLMRGKIFSELSNLQTSKPHISPVSPK